MAKEKKAKAAATKKRAEHKPGDVPGDVPNLFRINVEVGNLDEAVEFYGKLFGLVGRMQAGSRCYFSCGAVTLQVIDVSSVSKPHPAAKALYFVVRDLDSLFARATSLNCLSGRKCMASPAVGSACDRGVSVPSTLRIGGTTRSASWRQGRSIRGDHPMILDQ